VEGAGSFTFFSFAAFGAAGLAALAGAAGFAALAAGFAFAAVSAIAKIEQQEKLKLIQQKVCERIHHNLERAKQNAIFRDFNFQTRRTLIVLVRSLRNHQVDD
jgi:hypothetical protein